MIKIINPLEHLISLVSKKYPNLKCLILFNSDYQKENEGYANTLFPDDGSDPIITIDGSVPFTDCLELIAHELSHVICHQEFKIDLTTKSEKESHNDIWEKEFQSIFELFTNTYQTYYNTFNS